MPLRLLVHDPHLPRCCGVAPTSLASQFDQPYGPPTLFTIPVLRYMKTYGLSHEQLAMVSVVQREWAAKNPRATFKAPITVEDVADDGAGSQVCD